MTCKSLYMWKQAYKYTPPVTSHMISTGWLSAGGMNELLLRSIGTLPGNLITRLNILWSQRKGSLVNSWPGTHDMFIGMFN